MLKMMIFMNPAVMDADNPFGDEYGAESDEGF